jgi:hypothetical protein
MFGNIDIYEQTRYNRRKSFMGKLEKMKKDETIKATKLRIGKFNLMAIFILTIVALVTNIAHATDFYVSNNSCSDSNPGTKTQPICSINEVNSRVKVGDTVFFDRAGTWTAGSGSAVLVPKGGVSYIGDSWGTGDRATLLGNSGLRNAVVYFNDDDPMYETVVKGFDANANGKALDGISILHDGSENKNLTGANKRIENCLVHNTGSGYHYGITVAPNSTNERVSNVEIINNTVYDITRTGIANYPYSGCSGCGNSNILIQGNEVFNTGRDPSSAGHGILNKNDVKNTKIIANHLHDIDSLYTSNRGHSISVEDGSGTDPINITIRSNLIKENGTSWLYIANSVSANSQSTYDIDDNVIYANEVPNNLLPPRNMRIASTK